MWIWNNRKYSVVVGYGAGQCYIRTKSELSMIVKLDYLCDRKWDNTKQQEYDGIPIIKKDNINKLDNVIVIIFTDNNRVYESIKKELSGLQIESIHVDDIIRCNTVLNGKELKERFPNGVYEDQRQNRVYFDQSLSDSIKISFRGCGNNLIVERNVLLGNVLVRFGNNGSCTIGENTIIHGGELHIAYARIDIGRDCLVSMNVLLRTHDSHHIFDKETHKRMNQSEDIEIADHVWICQGAVLLGGTRIGTGSVVGLRSVTSGKFGSCLVIAGAPARIIKKNICWTKDDTEYFDYQYLEECFFQ